MRHFIGAININTVYLVRKCCVEIEMKFKLPPDGLSKFGNSVSLITKCM